MDIQMMWSEKYRPRRIDDIFGHEDIKARLKGFVESKSLPHLLFAGPPGTGKTSAVIALAHEILYENKIEGNLLELNASDDRGIDVIRNQVKSFARILPSNGAPFKIISLDEADALTSAAQHALRRTMEKYVNTSRFILLCNYPGKIIEPIQSRCAYFKFSRIPKLAISQRLKEIASLEKVEFEEIGIDTIIDISEGDMRKAINILQASAAIGGKITKPVVLETVGTVDKAEIIKLMKMARGGDFTASKNILQDLIYSHGITGQDILRDMNSNLNQLNLSNKELIDLIALIAEVDFRLTEGASADIQISSILAKLGIKE
ncbi:MAG: replication factor C small subunit [Candidatus Heimdallarchaeota archaeon]|nr:replication factor C small subunit [Candidatus Heimdallarchaeota archaeon]